MRARLLVVSLAVVAAWSCTPHRVDRSGAAGTATPSAGPEVTPAAPKVASESGGFAALMQSWHGHTINELFRTWGRPVYLYSDGETGQIAVYIPEADAGSSPRPAIPNDPRQSEALRVYDPRMADAWPIYRLFFADRTGRIVRSEWRGEWECCSR
jgi:hypothetical protein